MSPRSKKSYRRHDSAQVGIGTMIVFIATVLVAAIAAGVLIDTSGKLQERSSQTGNEATEQVASNLAVETVIGRRDTASDVGLDDMDIYVSLAPGAKEVDLAQLRIQLQNGTKLSTFNHSTVHPANAALQFSGGEIRDADGSFTSDKPVLTAGDLVNVTIPLDVNTDWDVEPRDQILLLLIPEVGHKIAFGFTTPASFGVKTVIELR